MRLLVANFDSQKIVHKEQVVKAVLELPHSHVRGIQVIRYDPDRAIATTLSYMTASHSPVTSCGLFYHDRETSVIVLFRFHTLAHFYHVLYHEIGHYVFLRALTQAQRDMWMYKIRPIEKETVTEYAKKNSREDFSETYACWLTNRSRLGPLPMRQAFFEKEVFGGFHATQYNSPS